MPKPKQILTPHPHLAPYAHLQLYALKDRLQDKIESQIG